MRSLLALEARVQWRYGVAGMLALLATAWTGLLWALPPAGSRAAAPWLLLLETALVGTTVAGALVLLERDHGMRAALAASPASVSTRLVAKVGVLALLVVGTAVPVALAGRPVHAGGLLLALLGVGLIAVLGMLVAVALAAHQQSVITFMIVLPLALLPLLLPALLRAAGLGHPVLYVVPTTGAADLMRAGYGHAMPAAVGWLAPVWLALSCLLAFAVARHQLRRPAPGRAHPPGPALRKPGPPSHRPPAGAAERSPRSSGRNRKERGPVRAFLRTDLASFRRDPLLVLISLSPLLLGLALRFGYPPASAWLADAYGFHLDPYRPVLLAAAVLLHVPVGFGMIGALLVLDDVDDRALTALRTSPLTLPRYLGYRAGLVTVVATIGLAVAVPLSGMAPATAWPRLVPAAVLASLMAPLFMLAVLALARNKVEGAVAVKLLGLPVYAPIAAWWLPGPAGWAFAVLPSWWMMQGLWISWVYALGGAALTAVALALLTRRVLARLAAT